MPKRQRVLVAMSGGVDSSVTAHLLQQQGYECLGATMVLSGCGGGAEDGTCGSTADLRDAEAVCKRLGIPWQALDLRPAFDRRVVEKFVRTYERGRTPNPCIDCNRHLKFGALLDHALEHGCDFIATGHYVRVGRYGRAALGENAPDPLLTRILREHGRAFRTLSCGVDAAKDQSYVLYSLTQERLAHTLFPLGGLVKERDVRRIAREQGFSNASKRDSQGICFVKDDDFAGYIERRRGESLPEGDIVDARGNVLGRHRGAIRYTVGQRKGLGVAAAHPLYVTGIDAQTNTVTLGADADLMARSLIADDWIWSVPADTIENLLDGAGSDGLAVGARIRYHHASQRCRMSRADGGAVRFDFDEAQRAIAPGQAVVAYAGDVVLGGGTVRRALA